MASDILTHCGGFSWKTRDGVKMKWAEMTPEHLARAVIHMRRRAEIADAEGDAAVGHVGEGEFSQDTASSAISASLDKAFNLRTVADVMEAYLNARLRAT